MLLVGGSLLDVETLHSKHCAQKGTTTAKAPAIPFCWANGVEGSSDEIASGHSAPRIGQCALGGRACRHLLEDGMRWRTFCRHPFSDRRPVKYMCYSYDTVAEMPLLSLYLVFGNGSLQCVPQPALARTQRRRRCALGFLPAPGKIGKHENVLLQRNKSITVRPGYCAPYRSRSLRVPIIIGKPVAAWRVILGPLLYCRVAASDIESQLVAA